MEFLVLLLHMICYVQWYMKTCLGFFSIRIGGEQRMELLILEHFLLMADDCEISKNLVLKELKLLASNLPQLANQLAEELNKTFPSPIYETIAWRIKLQCLQIMNDL